MLTLDMHVLPQYKVNIHAVVAASIPLSPLETINTQEPFSPLAPREAKGRFCCLFPPPQILPGPMSLTLLDWKDAPGGEGGPWFLRTYAS